MSDVSLERRLQKIEAARGRTGYAMFAAWGRTPGEAEQAIHEAKARGAVRPGDDAMAFVWSHPDPAPRSRWISFSGKHEAEISDRELRVMVDAMQAEQARHERDAALAAGEDVTGLDDTDFLIPSIRRERGDATTRLCRLAQDRNPPTAVHWPQTDGKTGMAVAYCTCPSCRADETTPMGSHRLDRARMKVWLARYLPGQEVFA